VGGAVRVSAATERPRHDVDVVPINLKKKFKKIKKIQISRRFISLNLKKKEADNEGVGV
jgi:hypothetical protein